MYSVRSTFSLLIVILALLAASAFLASGPQESGSTDGQTSLAAVALATPNGEEAPAKGLLHPGAAHAEMVLKHQ